jgi:peptide/nickel transport system ATP-binding protein
MIEPLLSVTGLDISVGDRLLVHDVSMQLAAGESLGLVGESGSGKSLTAKALVSLLPPGLAAAGSIRFAGATIDPTSRSGKHRGSAIALLMQDPFTMLNPMMTAGDHIAETLRSSGMARRNVDAEVARRLAEVGITDARVASRYPFELSGGMSQRVAMAAALANDPALLVADEPTTALDATTQHEVLELLRRIQLQRGMGLMLITHDLRLAFSVCDRVMVMYAGSIAEASAAADMRQGPRHPYAAGLLGSMPSIDRYQPSLGGIPGSVPSTSSVLGRCAFAERCSHRIEPCTQGSPPLIEVSPGRWSACVRDADLASSASSATSFTSALEAGGRPERLEATTPVLNVRDLCKSYGSKARRHIALGGVSLRLGAGEALGVVGESGSGKTTIARCILGLTSATSGQIVLGDVDVTDRRSLDKLQRRAAVQQVQCVFQDPYSTLNPMHNVGYTLGEALAHRARPVDDREFEVALLLERVGLDIGLAGRRPAALSGGQRQRVAIARALAMEPSVLVCDEPVAALDVSVQAQILGLLRAVHREQGTSLLFITHDLGVVRQVTDRIMVLFRGQVVEEGETDSVLDAPQHEYTQRLVASMPRVNADRSGA